MNTDKENNIAYVEGKAYRLIPIEQEDKIFICEIDGKKYYLGPEADRRMGWEESKTWCSSLGEGYELPSRVVMLMCYNNKELRKHFQTNDYYWTDDAYENDSSYGWAQYFFYGIQGNYLKTSARYVRAIFVE